MSGDKLVILNTSNPCCKHCNSTRVRKYGLYKGVQRYFCNDCGSKFKADDTLFHALGVLTRRSTSPFRL